MGSEPKPAMPKKIAREGLKELAGALRAHPSFAVASNRFMAEYVAWRGRLGVLNKVISNLGRERLVEHVLYLHFGRLGADYGATFERLASLSETRDRIGARAVRTALRLAQISGLAILSRSRADGRLRICEPAPPLLDLAGAYYAILFQLLDDLAPEFRACVRLATEPDFLATALSRMGRAYVARGFDRNLAKSPLPTLLRFEGARPILACVIDCCQRGVALPTSHELSRRFYVSPSQTRVILKGAETFGLIRTAGRGRLLDAAPLTEAYFDGLSRHLAFAALYGFETEDGVYALENAGA